MYKSNYGNNPFHIKKFTIVWFVQSNTTYEQMRMQSYECILIALGEGALWIARYLDINKKCQ